MTIDTKRLASFLKKQKHVNLAYLFGSAATGKMTKRSDIDIAVLFDKRLSKEERNKKKLLLLAELCSILKTNSVDIVVMNDAPASLNHEIISNGTLISSKNEDVRIKTEARIIEEFLDRQFYEQRRAQFIINKYAGGRK